MRREPVDATPRKAMTAARRAQAFAKTDGRCAYPECRDDAVEVDHIICLELGGKDEIRNLQGLCIPHHKQKTALDKKLIARAKRRRRKDQSLGRAKTPIRSAGFDRRLRKKLNGAVAPRGRRPEHVVDEVD